MVNWSERPISFVGNNLPANRETVKRLRGIPLIFPSWFPRAWNRTSNQLHSMAKWVTYALRPDVLSFNRHFKRAPVIPSETKVCALSRVTPTWKPPICGHIAHCTYFYHQDNSCWKYKLVNTVYRTATLNHCECLVHSQFHGANVWRSVLLTCQLGGRTGNTSGSAWEFGLPTQAIF